MPEFDRLLIFRTLRPDRLTAAMARFVANTLGEQYITSQPFDLERSFQASPTSLASAAIEHDEAPAAAALAAAAGPAACQLPEGAPSGGSKLHGLQLCICEVELSSRQPSHCA